MSTEVEKEKQSEREEEEKRPEVARSGEIKRVAFGYR